MAATMEPLVTVKQHGFVVKSSSASFAPCAPAVSFEGAPAEAPRLEEDGLAGSGLSRAALGLLGAGGVTPADRAAYAAAFGVSPGLPRAGDVRPAEFAHLTPGVKRIMRSVMRGLKAHQDPEAATEGLGGTYFFRNEAGAKTAIMKPCDEEPLAPNNPKGFVGRQLGDPGLKPTVRVGEAASREVAAYLLDHDHFAKVPHTVMVRMSHPVFHLAPPPPAAAAAASPAGSAAPGAAAEDPPSTPFTSNSRSFESDDEADTDQFGELPLKLGSLQEFVPHECDTSEVGASRFSVRDVQRIGILDIRLFNTDRHAGNILVRRAPRHTLASHASLARLDGPSGLANLCLQDRYELVPIDHGFALPEGLEPPYFEWQHWPQAMMPFGAEELEYVARLDPHEDAELLRRELPGLRQESLRVMEVSTTLLKKCVAAGLSLAEIAGVVTRPLIGLDDDPSPLEQICCEARCRIEAQERVAAAGKYVDEEEEADSDSGSGSEAGEDSELSDLEEGDESAEADVEREAGGLQTAPTFSPVNASGDSALTHYVLPCASTASSLGVNVARLPGGDDALFSMDEDGARTPLVSSPTAAATATLARLSATAPGLAVKRTGEMATPGAVVGMSFGSALASADSLPPSYDSGTDSPHGRVPSNAASIDSTVLAVGAAFDGPATYMPGGFATAAKQRQQRPGGGKVRRRRPAGGHPRRSPRAQAYPPLVEPRSCASGSAGIFTGLNDAQWAAFMTEVNVAIDAALHSGAWAQSAAGGPTIPMSCPN